MLVMRNRRIFFFISIVFFLFALAALIIWRLSFFTPRSSHFDGQRAYRDVLAQVDFGSRIPDSPAHEKNIAYILAELRKASWNAEIQKTTWHGFSIQNIIASQTGKTPHIILGAHYDSRLLADQDPGSGNNAPVPGANDGASGVAVLLELARTLPMNSIPTWLVFFDAEDSGGINGRDWIMGSRAFVAGLTFHPQAAIVVDMVGDADLHIYVELNSTANLVNGIWEQAAKLGYENQFIQTPKYSMVDDHTPFLDAGINAVDIIDFDYPFWHTSSDTPDKVSPKSLQVVGETLHAWISSQK
jgi:glutaminyl-peptide cyclotransferase